MKPDGWRDGESTVRFKKETEFAISKNIFEVLMSIGIFLSFSIHFNFILLPFTLLDVPEPQLRAELLPQGLHLQFCLFKPCLGLDEVAVDPTGPVDVETGQRGLLGVGQVYVYGPSVHTGVVQPGQRILSILCSGHSDEAESLAAPIIADNFSVQDRSEVGEELDQVVEVRYSKIRATV